MLMRFDPFRDLDRLTQQLAGPRQWMPMDAYRKDDRVYVHFDLPGVDPDSIELTVERNALHVSAERSWFYSDAIDVLASERPQGKVSRQLFLGENLDLDRLEANYDRGVLTLTIPVAESAKPRKVQVASGESKRAISV
ncbi:MAG TPA: Hsp20/alpha crystallin family protein [Acidimicrobiales bacterium]|nr:Hsp20/alpha crystallin family protein [Acidimicrobiales bacterium]